MNIYIDRFDIYSNYPIDMFLFFIIIIIILFPSQLLVFNKNLKFPSNFIFNEHHRIHLYNDIWIKIKTHTDTFNI